MDIKVLVLAIEILRQCGARRREIYQRFQVSGAGGVVSGKICLGY
jgi:hypothetical protein